MDFHIVAVPLLPGIQPMNNRIITHDMLDVFLWLPRREGFVVIDRNHCRVSRIGYQPDQNAYYEYTIIYLDQASILVCLCIRYLFISDRPLTPQAGATTFFANASSGAIEIII
jgi:hypothetical protein